MQKRKAFMAKSLQHYPPPSRSRTDPLGGHTQPVFHCVFGLCFEPWKQSEHCNWHHDKTWHIQIPASKCRNKVLLTMRNRLSRIIPWGCLMLIRCIHFEVLKCFRINRKAYGTFKFSRLSSRRMRRTIFSTISASRLEALEMLE